MVLEKLFLLGLKGLLSKFKNNNKFLVYKPVRFRSSEKFRVYVVMPLKPGIEGEYGTNRGAAVQAVTHWNYQVRFLFEPV